MEKKFLIIDGMNLIRRLYAALEVETDSLRRVERCQSLTIDALAKLAQQFSPSYAVVVFDASGQTWRHRIYPEYKLGRIPMDDTLHDAIASFAKLLRFNGFPCLRMEGWEADDLIATLAVKAAAKQIKSYIVSTDKGFTQLLGDEHILQYDYFAKLGYDKAWVPGKYGVEPHQLLDYWALVGDTTNRIPGVKGIGPKTAVTIIQQHASLEEIYAHLADFSPRIQTLLAGGYDQALQSRHLVELKVDVDIGVRLGQLRFAPVAKE